MLFIAMYLVHCIMNLNITYVFIPQGDEKPLATPNSSDTGFDEAMDISDGKILTPSMNLYNCGPSWVGGRGGV